jgi:hypothetical protein
MAEFGWQLRANDISTRGIVWSSDWVPRGPIMGCHVAPRYWLIVLFVKMYWSPWGSAPEPPHCIATSQSSSDQRTTGCALLFIRVILYLNLNYVINGRGVGSGLSPDPRSYHLSHVTICIYRAGVGCNGSSPDLRGMARICVKPWFYYICYMTIGYTERCTGGFKRLRFSPFANAQGHMTSTCPGARQLGAGAPITVLQFAPLARLHPVLGFHAIYCMCARFIGKGCVL